ncbi:MAG: hypothetical protein M5U34_39225 [Chloroflexi bacterium]|nr:hypothetical protein [Chloroflexota bacterium]
MAARIFMRKRPFTTAYFILFLHFARQGFSLFDNGFVAYQDDLAFNVIINLISISGAIGFFVLGDAQVALRQMWHRQAHRLTVHSRLALSVLALMSGLATAVFLIVETFPPNKAIDVNLMTASFQTITAVSTTGFNTVDISKLTDTSLLVLAILMFVGSPAGGTGGGIKSTTFGVLILWLWAFYAARRMSMCLVAACRPKLWGKAWALPSPPPCGSFRPRSSLPGANRLTFYQCFLKRPPL